MRNGWLVLVIAFVGCGPSSSGHTGGGGGGGGMPPMPTLTSIDITPPSVALVTTQGGAAAAQQFVATGHFSDGSTADVSSMVGWSLSDANIGAIANGAFTGAPTRGGIATLSAGNATVQGTAMITVKYVASRISTSDGSTAPMNSPSLFGGSDDPTLAPTLAYPLDGAKVPHNLGLLEVQWKKPATATDLYEVSLESATLDFKAYTNAATTRLALTPAEWQSISDSVAGGSVAVKVRAVQSANPAKVGSSVAAMLAVATQPVSGGIYYFAPVSATGTQIGAIMRHQFGDTTGTAKQFYAPSAGMRCVGCHVINHDGNKMAVTFDGGNNNAAILSVPALNPVMNESANPKWNFASYSPDGMRMVATSGGEMVNGAAVNGSLRILDTSGGATNGQVLQVITDGSAGHYASHPDWSPDGSKIVYVSAGMPSSEWDFKQGSIVVVSDGGMGMFGNPQVLVQSQGENNYYPSFSPDGKWILFNRAAATASAYNATSAEIYVISTDGKIGPIALGNANSTAQGVTNSWPRWNPFVVTEPSGALMYITFSSIRDYGIELVGANQPQIWMAAFDPAKAQSNLDPSSTAFWMPFQDVKSHNHIAQWTATYIQ